ncbi:MAG TPA: tryptophan--tRNA ligase [Bacteroidetes bacterium]|nr:tryptophan--tRNA ligase [Bacteroidota bacterium]
MFEQKKERILSGMRPSGKLHLGNLTGALENWVKLQDDYENFHFVADWHTLTTDYKHSARIWPDTIDMVIDWLAAGLDPEKSTLFVQSHIKEHAELHLLFSMLVTIPRLERNPTVKEQIRELHLEDRVSYGHFGYPVLQAADILMYRAHAVPVGDDQVPHVELTREIARKFNQVYGKVFPVPKALLTKFSRLPGLDGSKMSKSKGNTILLSDRPDVIRKKVRSAITDPQKIRMGDPGHPEVCSVFTYHQKFNPTEIPEIEAECKKGTLGCVACKNNLSDKLINFLEPIQVKRIRIEADQSYIKDVLRTGNSKARKEAQETMELVRENMKFGYFREIEELK